MQNVQLVADLCTQITQKRRTNVNEIFHKSRNGNAKFSYYYTISTTATVDGSNLDSRPAGWLAVFESNCFDKAHTHTQTEINIIERGKRALRTSCRRVATVASVAPPIGLLLG